MTTTKTLPPYTWFFVMIRASEYVLSPTLRRITLETLTEVYPAYLKEMGYIAMQGHQVYKPSGPFLPIPLPNQAMEVGGTGLKYAPEQIVRLLMQAVLEAMEVDWEWVCQPCSPKEAIRFWAETASPEALVKELKKTEKKPPSEDEGRGFLRRLMGG